MTDQPIPASKLDRPEILSAIFFPVKTKRSAPPPAGRDIDITVTKSGTTLGCRFYKAKRDDPLLIYFHGNGETVADYDDIAPFYTDSGLNILVTTYRGYGWSTGEPSVSALYEDCARILDHMLTFCAENGLTGPLFIMGRSLGSVSAIELAHRFPDRIKGLIVESGFADTIPLAARLGFDLSNTDITETDCFNNIEKIREISMPTLIMHGALDQLIPLFEAEKLQAESGARTKQFFTIPGADHNSLIAAGGVLYFQTIKNFIDTTSGRNTWRQRRKKFKQQEEQ